MQNEPESPSKKSQPESEQGIIIFHSCSPRESASEIDELQQGSFTYALLEALTNRGEINAATVERLDAYLRHRVPEINQQYRRPHQTPYTVLEPALNHLILLPNQATLGDVEQLKLDALQAEIEGNLELAKQLWTHILAVSPANTEALEAVQRIRQKTIGEEALSLQTFTFETVTVNRRGEIIKQDTKLAQYFTEDLGNGITLDMVAIPGGTFMMGSPKGEGYDSEEPQHEVTVPPFFMGKYPITQAQWRAITSLPKVERDLKLDPSHFKGDRRPVEQVSWDDAVKFCQRLSKQTGKEYRLPSEAEWEYACRARTTTPFNFGETITDQLANYRASENYASEPKGEYRKQTTPVGSFPPNAFGLYDMHGQVLEWCQDDWHGNYEGAPTNGSAWLSGASSIKVVRSGSCLLDPSRCRSAARIDNNCVVQSRDIGLRVVCVMPRTT